MLYSCCNDNISDFMLISGAEQELLALSYNVLRYVDIALILKQCV